MTIVDVAREAGVSPATVSHVINQSRPVAPETRGRVEAAIRKLRYRRDGIARSLRRSRTGTIGLVITDITSPFFADMARAVEDGIDARDTNCNVILCSNDGDVRRERAVVELLLEKRVDGMIIAASGGNADLMAEMLGDGFPLVFVDREKPAVEVDRVLVDNRAAARQAVTHLLDLGHRSIAVLQVDLDISTTNERFEGYVEALTAAGLRAAEHHIRRAPPKIAAARQAAVALLDGPSLPDAVFCTNEFMTIGLMQALAERGLRCPDDIAIVGFDDFPWASALRPRLTAVAQPSYAIGQTAAALLLERIGADQRLPPRRILLPTELRIRQSCGAALADRGHRTAPAAAVVAP